MTEMSKYFTLHARLSRRTLARFAETELERIDQAADDLGFGALLRLDEAEEVLAELDREDEADPDEDGDDDPENDDDGADREESR